jgi:hypothetical protein
MPHAEPGVLDVSDLDSEHLAQAQARAHCQRVPEVSALVGPRLGEELDYLLLREHPAACGLPAELH